VDFIEHAHERRTEERAGLLPAHDDISVSVSSQVAMNPPSCFDNFYNSNRADCLDVSRDGMGIVQSLSYVQAVQNAFSFILLNAVRSSGSFDGMRIGL
jgi:hypothetical protein